MQYMDMIFEDMGDEGRLIFAGPNDRKHDSIIMVELGLGDYLHSIDAEPEDEEPSQTQ